MFFSARVRAHNIGIYNMGILYRVFTKYHFGLWVYDMSINLDFRFLIWTINPLNIKFGIGQKKKERDRANNILLNHNGLIGGPTFHM